MGIVRLHAAPVSRGVRWCSGSPHRIQSEFAVSGREQTAITVVFVSVGRIVPQRTRCAPRWARAGESQVARNQGGDFGGGSGSNILFPIRVGRIGNIFRGMLGWLCMFLSADDPFDDPRGSANLVAWPSRPGPSRDAPRWPQRGHPRSQVAGSRVVKFAPGQWHPHFSRVAAGRAASCMFRSTTHVGRPTSWLRPSLRAPRATRRDGLSMGIPGPMWSGARWSNSRLDRGINIFRELLRAPASRPAGGRRVPSQPGTLEQRHGTVPETQHGAPGLAGSRGTIVGGERLQPR